MKLYIQIDAHFLGFELVLKPIFISYVLPIDGCSEKNML